MKNLLTVITTLFCVVLINSSSLNAQTIAFERSSSDEIWTSDINGDNLQFICEGREPDISPNGMYIAFTKGYRVGYVNVKTKETHIFNSIPTDRCHEPKWSPNRDMIAFMYLSPTWRVGVVDFEDTYFNPLSEVKESVVLQRPAWDQEGEYVLFHDGAKISKVDLNGNKSTEVPYNNMISPYPIFEVTRFKLSNDGNYLLFDTMVENERIKGDAIPPNAVFIHNLLTGNTNRVTPIGMDASHPCWLSQNKIIFDGFTEDDLEEYRGNEVGVIIHRSIYSIDIEGNDLKKVIEDGWQPSISKASCDKPEK